MESDLRALAILAQTYFDAAYDMDADRFAALFHPASSVTAATRTDDGVQLSVTPIAAWLERVRTATAPRLQHQERHDELLSIEVVRELAILKLTLQIAPRAFTDVLSCAKIAGGWTIVQKLTLVEPDHARSPRDHGHAEASTKSEDSA